jgi:glucosamine--fructose-6-phosphate aminotransferase (isomerizing)
MQSDRRMEAELRETPQAVANQAAQLGGPVAALAARLKARPPQVVVTCARGSSAHAATFGKHLIERYLGIPVAAAAPSVATVYRRALRLENQLFLAVSQSGASDDLVEQAQVARRSGALTAALVNATDSPLARACEIVLPMAAGAEHSVAATKTFVASLAALMRLAAAWSEEAAIGAALERLPDRLAGATELDWGAALPALADAVSLITIGRGPTLAIAREASLKLKETCNLHAEAFSSAEVRHGPVTLVSTQYPVIIFMPTDAAATGMRALAEDLRAMKASLFVAESGAPAPWRLPALAPDQPEADAICLIQSFYALAVRLSARRGLDADRPRHLRKVTRTR